MDLGLGVDGDFERLGVVPILLPRGRHVIEDKIGLGEFLQGFGFLDAFEAIAHSIEDVPEGALAGQAIVAVAFVLLESLADLAGGQVGVPACGLHLGVSLGARLDDAADVSGELGIFDLRGSLAAGGEVFDTADAPAGLVQARGDRRPPPAEAAFSVAWVAAAQFGGDLGLEESALLALEGACRTTDQLLERLGGSGHRVSLG
jgi:hypothetical protein